MATELSKEEEKSLDDLSANMQLRLLEYKNSRLKLSKNELQVELKDLNEYLEGCRNSEIDDTLINIRFCEDKANILEDLISGM